MCGVGSGGPAARGRAAPAEGASEDPGAQIDRATELQGKWQTAPGQLWEVPSATVMGRAHRLLCGDLRRAEDTLRVMGGSQTRWCWTDPPYGVEYEGKTADALRIQNDGAKDLPELLRRAFTATDTVLAEGAPIYVAHPAGPLSLEFGRAFWARAGISTRRSSGSRTRWSSATATITISTNRSTG